MPSRPPTDETVLGADTTVVIDGEILAKPEDAADARRMLALLSGRRHEVLTGICLRRGADAVCDYATTGVVFAALSDAEIHEYVATGEPMDKAGAYAIQGLASKFVERIEGDYFNVMGLPVALVYRRLREALASGMRRSICPAAPLVRRAPEYPQEVRWTCTRWTGGGGALAMWLAAERWPGRSRSNRGPGPHPRNRTRPGRANIRVDTTLILVPVTVNDPLNRPVSGLEKENFRVFEDKVQQPITQFAMDDEPVAVGLVFDTSGSMGDKLQRSRMAAREFFRIANPEDEFFLVEFDNAPRLRVPLTSDTGTIENELIFSKSKGSTALLDAIYLALHEMKRSKKNKKALLMISDGGDNHSRYSQKEVTNVVRESDVLIYSIGVFGGGTTPEEVGGPGLLAQDLRTDRRTPVRSQSGGTAGHRQEDRHRTAQPLHPRIFAAEPGARRKVPPHHGAGGAAARAAEIVRPLALGLQRAGGVGRGYAGSWRTSGGNIAFMKSTAVLVAASASPSRTGTTIFTSEVSLRWNRMESAISQNLAANSPAMMRS